MDLNKLFIIQKEFDKLLSKNVDKSSCDLLPQKTLALQASLGSLANKTNCFKFWGHEEAITKESLLDEYVETLNFLLSIGIDNNYIDLDITLNRAEYKITDQFLGLYIDINDFITCSCEDQYNTLVEDFLNLGLSLGFTEEEMESAYLEMTKNFNKKEKLLH